MRANATITNDITVFGPTPVIPSPHSFFGWSIPPGPVPFPSPIGLAVELAMPIFNPMGHMMGKHKLTETVMHKSLPIAQGEHDIGNGIVHVQVLPSPLNLETILHVMFSSRKVVFDSSRVIMNGKHTACCGLIQPDPPMLMKVCGQPIGVMAAHPPTNLLNTLNIGMSERDYFFCRAHSEIEDAADILMFAVWQHTKPASESAKKTVEELLTDWCNKKARSVIQPPFVNPNGDVALGQWAVKSTLTAGVKTLRQALDGETLTPSITVKGKLSRFKVGAEIVGDGVSGTAALQTGLADFECQVGAQNEMSSRIGNARNEVEFVRGKSQERTFSSALSLDPKTWGQPLEFGESQ